MQITFTTNTNIFADTNWWKPITAECRQAAKDAHFNEKQLKLDSQTAWFNGDKILAKELSNEAKAQRQSVEKFNRIASTTTFLALNHELEPSFVDLDGLFKDEAVVHLNRKVTELNCTGEVKCLLKPNKSSPFEIGRMKRIVSSYCKLQGYDYHESNDDQFGECLVVNMGNQPRRVSGVSKDDFVYLLKDEIPIESMT